MLIVQSILVLCRGNICRSPMAEGFFKEQFKSHTKKIHISSAGIQALVNSSPEPHALEVMKSRNIDISDHRARQITQELVSKANLILVMSLLQLRNVTQCFSMATGKTFLLGYWRNLEIKDPYRQPFEIFQSTYNDIESACQDWKLRISEC